MTMFYLLVGAAIFVFIIFAKFIWQSFFVEKQKSNAKQTTKNRLFNVNEKMDENKPDFWSDFKRKTVTKYKGIPLLGLSENNREYLQQLLDATETDSVKIKTPEEVHFDQMLYLAVYVVACLLLSLFWKYAIIGLLGAYAVYRMPITNIKDKYEKGMKEITFQFPAFFDTVYVQYNKKDTSILMSDIVSTYIPIATGAFRRLLKRFLLDLEQGEDYALRSLDARYSDSSLIHKFCSIMRLRLKGDEASYLAMSTFRDTLQANVKDWMLADLEKRKKKANKITAFMVTFILAIVMIVYFATFIGMSL
mgnify:CR=1 FL=1